MEIVEGSEFNAIICPEDIDSEDYIEKHKDTINFHAQNKKTSVDNIITSWKNGLKTKTVFEQYDRYIQKQIGTTEAVAGGQNIRSFDLPILKRYLNQYKLPYRFFKREEFDLLDFCSHWFLYAKNPPKNYKLDTLLNKFQIDATNAHDALVDVKNTASILIRFLDLHRRLIGKIPNLNE